METNDYVFFYGHTPNNCGLHVFSQWYPITFKEKLGDLEFAYSNAEQYMMAHKAMLFGDDYYLKKILEESDPGKVKKFGRCINNFDPDVWDKHKFNIVVQASRLKFGQNSALMERLLKTGTKTIVEASPYDKIWGIGLTKEKAVKIPEDEWPGLNLLGKALMVVRDENI